jgi:hypothetical protein
VRGIEGGDDDEVRPRMHDRIRLDFLPVLRAVVEIEVDRCGWQACQRL